MFYKIMHYISKYSLMILVYSIILNIVFEIFSINYITINLTTLIYLILIKKQILIFDSIWLERG